MLMSFLHVALGGALGSMARFGVSLGALRLFGPAFPFGTLAVNVIGSFAMGICAVALAQQLRPVMMTGIIGGFTTFSAFSLDLATLWERGAVGLAALYLSASLVLSIGALFAGLVLARAVFA